MHVLLHDPGADRVVLVEEAAAEVAWHFYLLFSGLISFDGMTTLSLP